MNTLSRSLQFFLFFSLGFNCFVHSRLIVFEEIPKYVAEFLERRLTTKGLVGKIDQDYLVATTQSKVIPVLELKASLRDKKLEEEEIQQLVDEKLDDILAKEQDNFSGKGNINILGLAGAVAIGVATLVGLGTIYSAVAPTPSLTLFWSKENLKEQWQQYLDSCMYYLQIPDFRVIQVPKDLEHLPLIWLLSLRQPGGWQCGVLSVFNMMNLDLAVHNKSFNFSYLDDLSKEGLLDYKNYTWDSFAEFYDYYVVKGNLWGKKPLFEDEISGLLCPQPDPWEDQIENWLWSDSLWKLARMISDSKGRTSLKTLLNRIYVLGRDEEKFITILEGVDLLDWISASNEVDARNYLIEKRDEFIKCGNARAIHFICREDSDHWILITIFKDRKRSNNLAMILMDSSKSYSSEAHLGRDTRKYIKFLSKIFFPDF